MTDKSPTNPSHRDTVERVRHADSFAVKLPIVGSVGIPRPEHLAFYAALGVLAALEVIEWPVAVIVAAGHVMAAEEHHRTLHEVGDALESA
ncbi:hypothetical protein ACVH9Z_04805 [Rhodococcus opacus]|jgi:hypothetical protein|uniref:Uncharacterized protein n=1 Tax=Rhodococcus opacus TaxID=37919 RepID=A0A1B1KFP5_RHOOP|nr:MULTISPECIES: hypothetical protein [Rhodococcus]ELB88892.1 hypothetical protein Rwratislav_32510 [Rhodococcus wratislaviensis IFP 2016]NHU48058.1 hypothetical protein [Rhodococcus sp. A14]ANS31409.1 hypothetical protein R1CP_33970 [Rhodococcus opacus]MBA8961372.1 hypothetical protein [Rhodococcus opacus]MBP2202764.1 hypothetical protein [Rhodococcus opacus]